MIYVLLVEYIVTDFDGFRRLSEKANLYLNSSLNDKIVDWSKLKAFADDKIIVTEKKITFVFERIENMVGEGENAGDQHFLLFPTCFQKDSYI